MSEPVLAHGWTALNRRMRVAAYLVACGLAVQAGTLVWTRPPTFLVFLCVGTVLVGLGALTYLFAIARHPGLGLVEAPTPGVDEAPAAPPAPVSPEPPSPPERIDA